MKLDLDTFFVFDKAKIYDFFSTCSKIPFGWLIKLGRRCSTEYCLVPASR